MIILTPNRFGIDRIPFPFPANMAASGSIECHFDPTAEISVLLEPRHFKPCFSESAPPLVCPTLAACKYVRAAMADYGEEICVNNAPAPQPLGVRLWFSFALTAVLRISPKVWPAVEVSGFGLLLVETGLLSWQK